MPCQNHPGVNEGLLVCWRCRREFCSNCTVELQQYYFCADCKTAQVRDILAGTDMLTPDYASLGRRFLAAFIDGFILGSINMAISFVAQSIAMGLMVSKFGSPLLGPSLTMFGSFAGIVVGVMYEGFMLSGNRGQTLGKMALSIRVVTPDGEFISKGQAWSRGLMKIILPNCCSCIGLAVDVAFVLGPERASLHDLVAKTRVVNAD
jgi:uncharacterized RDD family membrane protein YckC